MINKNEIIDYIESAPIKKAKQLGIVMTAMLSEKQLETLDKRFTKKVEFSPKPARKLDPEEEEEPEETEEPQDEPMPVYPEKYPDLPQRAKPKKKTPKQVVEEEMAKPVASDDLGDMEFNFEAD